MIASVESVVRACALISFCIVAAGLVGCKTGEAKDAGFVDKSDMVKDPSLPFQRSWEKPGLDKSRYTKLYVAPVNTDYMLNKTEWQEGMHKDDFERDLTMLATFTREAIMKAFREDPNHRMQILDVPSTDPDVLVVEVAIVEVVPSKVLLNAMGYLPFGVGLAINLTRLVADDVSTCAMETRIRDASTQEIVEKMADREAQQVAPVTVRGLTWYSNAETIITQWANQLVKVTDRKPGETVEGVDPVTLQPW